MKYPPPENWHFICERRRRRISRLIYRNHMHNITTKSLLYENCHFCCVPSFVYISFVWDLCLVRTFSCPPLPSNQRYWSINISQSTTTTQPTHTTKPLVSTAHLSKPVISAITSATTSNVSGYSDRFQDLIPPSDSIASMYKPMVVQFSQHAKEGTPVISIALTVS